MPLFVCGTYYYQCAPVCVMCLLSCSLWPDLSGNSLLSVLARIPLENGYCSSVGPFLG